LQSESSSKQQKKKKKSNWGKKSGNAHQVDKIRDQNNDSSNIYQTDSAIAFVSIATISSSIHPLPSKPLIIVSQLADQLSAVYTPQSDPIWESQVQAKL